MYEEFMGTKPVAERLKVDLDALSAYMHDHVQGFQGHLQIEQFKGGQSNPTFKLSSGDQHYVLRTKPAPAAKLLPSAHAIGRAFYIMQFVDGRVLWDQSLPGMSNEDRAAHYDEMNRVIAQLHSLDYKLVGLETFGKPGNYFQRQIDRWIRQYKAAETEHIPAMEHLIEWLPKHIPEGEITTIVHGDYRLDNMIFHPTEPKILAVLDWELSTLGHPLADFSYHCMSWHIEPGLFRGIGGLDLKALGIPTKDEYIARYSERTGIQINKEDFRFYLAYNMFRMAGILQGIMKRYQDGTAASEQALKSGQAAKPMAIMGWDYASGARPV